MIIGSYAAKSIANHLQMKTNAFLMPYSGNEEKELGEVPLALFAEDDLLPIKVIFLSVRKMYKKYLGI